MLRACACRAGKFGEGDTLDAQVPISAYARTERGMGRQPHPTGGFGGLEAPQGARGGLPPAIRGRSPRTRGVWGAAAPAFLETSKQYIVELH